MEKFKNHFPSMAMHGSWIKNGLLDTEKFLLKKYFCQKHSAGNSTRKGVSVEKKNFPAG